MQPAHKKPTPSSKKRHSYQKPHLCPICLHTFYTSRAHAKTCGPKCRQTLSRLTRDP